MSQPPADSFIPIAKPWISEEEIELVGEVLRSGWVTQGPQVAAFEREFAAGVGAAHACAVSSCTTALHLALLVAGIEPGDEVITVSHSFIATANVIRYCSAMPVFVDIDPRTFNVDPERIQAAITPKTRAILCVHQVGMPCDLQRIVELGRAHSLPVIEDAACAIGSEIRWGQTWEKIGKPHGDLACFSFHPRKLLTTGDGGMVTTNNAAWDERLRRLRQHGMTVPDTVRHAAQTVVFESYEGLGFNYRLTDIQAAIGRRQLQRLPEIIQRRRFLAARYAEQLDGIDDLELPYEPEWARSNWQSYCVRLPDDADQQTVMQHMLDNGVATRRGVMCAHREPAYPKGTWSCGPTQCECSGACGRLIESERAQDHTIVLPLFQQMTEAEQDRVSAVLRTVLSRASAHQHLLQA